jgi:hypothetical protein
MMTRTYQQQLIAVFNAVVQVQRRVRVYFTWAFTQTGEGRRDCEINTSGRKEADNFGVQECCRVAALEKSTCEGVDGYRSETQKDEGR